MCFLDVLCGTMGLEKLLKGLEQNRLGNELPLISSLKATPWWRGRARPPP